MADQGTETFYAELVRRTENAYLFSDGDNEFWIPKSQVIEMEKMGGSDYEVTIPYWLAKAKEII
jgi:hypothetical protein